jgi:hypothetical protein
MLGALDFEKLTRKHLKMLITLIKEDGADDAEAFFVDLLARDHDATIMVAAQLLGEIGRPNCIESLGEKTEGWFTDGEVKTAINAAIENIRTRFRAQEVRITVVEDREAQGDLSLSDEQKGRVALAKKVKTPQ